ncbi:adenine nucleotide alpha hydrolases-like protein [Xylona heveae TC161]|uniref:Diphthine--ammonia ligase n=1 Tax=Xylona heveae (strain CBS 132557 / TC161) TaxID=1328760 RepID=A0A165JW71_XYLHT|nr:adenine nucleotide alpha hydrolases-like protein [Xylona heveae TC161]KZF26700.1 adenine nucleotide alpha hydrolases-like protein [Xylona heveae TC161]
MAGLKVIALISGGKDSLFSILHCLANGHEVVALANLYPAAKPDSHETIDDLDSYMYQTVGHAVIPLYEEALGIPLYRQEILGTAVNADKNYSFQDSTTKGQDETESLVPLLRRVMEAHPEANAVSTGAILSDYQRTRVESVSIRLGLTPLSYLWQYPYLPPNVQSSLLDDMEAVGQDARIIKVASGGMDESFLWENVASAKTKRRLARAMQRFGGNEGGAILGEGGEFETLAVDGPAPLWKKRISVDEAERLVVVGEGGSASVKIRNARMAEKPAGEIQENTTLESLRTPDLLDTEFSSLLESLRADHTLSVEAASADSQRVHVVPVSQVDTRQTLSKSNCFLSNLTCCDPSLSAGEQMSNISEHLRLELARIDRSPDDIVFSTILLRSMSEFAHVNQIYSKLFSKPNPPARVTVACGDILPSGAELMLSVVVHRDESLSRRGLHVQSRSYWAPANIGPYSQSIATPLNNLQNTSTPPSIVYVAGQIPLRPASMDLTVKGPENSEIPMDFNMQTTLSLQHLWRIGQTMGVNWWTNGVAYLAGLSDTDATKYQQRAIIAWNAWKHMHSRVENDDSGDSEDDQDIDVWDQTHGRLNDRSFAPQETVRTLPDMQRIKFEQENVDSCPPFLAVEVDELPRGSAIEWASLGVAQCNVSLTVTGSGSDYQCVLENGSSFALATVPLSSDGADMTVKTLRDLSAESSQAEKYVTHFTLYTSKPVPIPTGFSVQLIPCRSVWGRNGQRLAAGIVIRREPLF